jgi:hypothetical protein
MKAITKPILRAVIGIPVLKQTRYFFKISATNMKYQNKRLNKANLNLSCFRGIYYCC